MNQESPIIRLLSYIKKRALKRSGIDKVVIEDTGRAIAPFRAQQYGIYKEDIYVIYVREDDWVLAAPEKYAKVAEEMYDDQWLVEIRKADGARTIWEKNYIRVYHAKDKRRKSYAESC